MQKLSEKLRNTPTSTSLACSSVSRSLNKEEPLSVVDKVLSDNSSEENQHQHTDGHNVIVYVLNKSGNPLMPCKPAKARHLLEQNKAKVISRKPFTIQLLWNCEHNIQPVKLGIDAGYQHVGISATSDKKELFSAEVTLRTDIPKKLQTKAMYRRQKRNRLWHRKPRFLNRSKPKGWLVPSIQHKLNSHVRIVEKVKKLLPITKVIVEVASFDIQKIKNPDIQDTEYQQGEQLGFWNVREYVLHRDNHTCQHCHEKKKDKILQTHHINGKAEGATDRPEELLTVCKTCHDEHHKGIDIIPKKKIKNFKPETFMTTVRWKIVNTLGCKHTYGHITKHNRIKQGLQKSHINDAFIIAGGTSQERCKSYIVKQIRRNSRRLQINRKGFAPSIRRQHYALQPNDIVKYNGKEHLVKTVHCRGLRIVISDLTKKIDVNIKKVKLVMHGKGIQFRYPRRN